MRVARGAAVGISVFGSVGAGAGSGEAGENFAEEGPKSGEAGAGYAGPEFADGPRRGLDIVPRQTPTI